MTLECFICGKKLKNTPIQKVFFFWRDEVVYVRIDTDEFMGMFPMCQIHGNSAEEHPHTTEALVYARIKAIINEHRNSEDNLP